MARKLGSYSLIAILFLSSIGLPVFTHVCNGKGKTWSSLFVPPAGCCDNVSKATNICAPETKTTQDCTFSMRPCCEDEVSLAALSTDFTFQFTSTLSLLPIAAIPVAHFYPNLIGYSNHTAVQKNRFDHFHSPRYGRSLLIFEQLFLC